MCLQVFRNRFYFITQYNFFTMSMEILIISSIIIPSWYNCIKNRITFFKWIIFSRSDKVRTNDSMIIILIVENIWYSLERNRSEIIGRVWYDGTLSHVAVTRGGRNVSRSLGCKRYELWIHRPIHRLTGVTSTARRWWSTLSREKSA